MVQVESTSLYSSVKCCNERQTLVSGSTLSHKASATHQFPFYLTVSAEATVDWVAGLEVSVLRSLTPFFSHAQNQIPPCLLFDDTEMEKWFQSQTPTTTYKLLKCIMTSFPLLNHLCFFFLCSRVQFERKNSLYEHSKQCLWTTRGRLLHGLQRWRLCKSPNAVQLQAWRVHQWERSSSICRPWWIWRVS